MATTIFFHEYKIYTNDNEDNETNISFDMCGLPRYQQRQRTSVILQETFPAGGRKPCHANVFDLLLGSWLHRMHMVHRCGLLLTNFVCSVVCVSLCVIGHNH